MAEMRRGEVGRVLSPTKTMQGVLRLGESTNLSMFFESRPTSRYVDEVLYMTIALSSAFVQQAEAAEHEQKRTTMVLAMASLQVGCSRSNNDTIQGPKGTSSSTDDQSKINVLRIHSPRVC